MIFYPSFTEMANADPYPIAAAALHPVFGQTPLVERSRLEQVLRTMCAEKGPTILGFNTEVLPIEIVEARTILIWERALVAARRMNGSGEYQREGLILLDFRMLQMSPVELAQHLKLAP